MVAAGVSVLSHSSGHSHSSSTSSHPVRSSPPSSAPATPVVVRVRQEEPGNPQAPGTPKIQPPPTSQPPPLPFQPPPTTQPPSLPPTSQPPTSQPPLPPSSPHLSSSFPTIPPSSPSRPQPPAPATSFPASPNKFHDNVLSPSKLKPRSSSVNSTSGVSGFEGLTKIVNSPVASNSSPNVPPPSPSSNQPSAFLPRPPALASISVSPRAVDQQFKARSNPVLQPPNTNQQQ